MNAPLGAAGRRATNEVASWVPPLARLGYAAKGVVYLIIGYLAFRAATAAGSPEGATGALSSLADETGGQLLLLLVALGLLAHAAWRVVQGVLDPEHHEHDAKHMALRAFYLLSAVIYGSLAWTAFQLSRGRSQGGDGSGQQLWIAKLMDLPAGRWLVMAAGLGVIAYGLHQLVKAWKADVRSHMTRDDQWIVALGRLGIGARGLVLLPVGWFVFNAGRHYNAQAAGGTDQALQMLDRGGLLAVVGIGLVAYGLHQFAKAAWRRIERPT
ncbi:membrane protein [Lysobacter bugurensis]|uniref:Membrane protein n=2 Tax=Cognatilysobacter bugurensis TaxID=543356 RepID=A0A918SRQ0_9GAMM|nr:membrane protein [Lysobacter bugurensis]